MEDIESITKQEEIFLTSIPDTRITLPMRYKASLGQEKTARHWADRPNIEVGSKKEFTPVVRAVQDNTMVCTCDRDLDMQEPIEWTDEGSLAHADFVKDPGHVFWKWSEKEGQWYHEEPSTGVVTFFPSHLD